MTPSDRDAPVPAATPQWAEFNRLFGDRVRASDASWAKRLQPPERIAIVEDLFGTLRTAHDRAGDWRAIDARAWAETLEARRRFVASFEAYGEGFNGRAPLANAG